MTREQALAFVYELLKSQRVLSHLGAALGLGGLPSLKDFDGTSDGAVRLCDDLIGYLEEVSGILRELQKNRARQAEIDFTKSLAGKFYLNAKGTMGPYDTVKDAAAAALQKVEFAKVGDEVQVYVMKAVDFPALRLAEGAINQLNNEADGKHILEFDDSEWPRELTEEEALKLDGKIAGVVREHLAETHQWPVLQLEESTYAEIPDPVGSGKVAKVEKVKEDDAGGEAFGEGLKKGDGAHLGEVRPVNDTMERWQGEKVEEEQLEKRKRGRKANRAKAAK